MIAQNKKTRRFFLPAGFNPYDLRWISAYWRPSRHVRHVVMMMVAMDALGHTAVTVAKQPGVVKPKQSSCSQRRTAL